MSRAAFGRCDTMAKVLKGKEESNIIFEFSHPIRMQILDMLREGRMRLTAYHHS
jgi:hypothetical protein